MTSKVEVQLLPSVFNRPSRLQCKGGWNDEATNAFRSAEFDCLELVSGRGQSIRIPNLGTAAHKLRAAELSVVGQLTGFEQFDGIESLTLPLGVPENGLGLSKKAKVRELTLQCTSRMGSLPVEGDWLERLGLIGWARDDASELSHLDSLRDLSFSQGRIKSLSGLESLPVLESLSIAYTKELSRPESISELRQLRSLDIENATRLDGTLSISDFDSLRLFRIVSSPVVANLEGLGNHSEIEVLWLNGLCAGLDWETLLSAPLLRIAAIPVGLANPELSRQVSALAASKGRKIRKLELVGPKGAKILQIVLE